MESDMTLHMAQQFAKWFNVDAWGLNAQLKFETVDDCKRWLDDADAKLLWKFFVKMHYREKEEEKGENLKLQK